jgi:DNA-binding PadR family transcriptional regulator
MVLLHYSNHMLLEADIKAISNKETALLGLLCEEPMHPYQIEKTAEYREMRSWTEMSMSSIYKVLLGLEKRGLVRSSVRLSGKNVAQKRYSITTAGRQALQGKLRELLSEPEKMIYRFDLGAYNLDRLAPDEARACLQAYDQKLEAGIECYRQLEKFLAQCDCPAHRRAIASRPQALLKAEREWLRGYLAALPR